MNIRSSILLMLLTILLVCSGCQSIGTLEKIYDSQDPYQGSSYRASLDRWTRQVRIYVGGFDLELIAAATFKSLPFRRAYTAEYARVYRLTPPETEKMLNDQTDAALLSHEFMIAAFMPDKRWNDLQDKDTIWKLFLSRSDGSKIPPIEARRIKNVDAVITHFFPHVSPWDVVYRVRFPVLVPGTNEPVLTDDSAPIKLVVTSVRGSAEMIWDPSESHNDNARKGTR